MAKKYRCVGGPQHGKELESSVASSIGYVTYKLDKRWPFNYYLHPDKKVHIHESFIMADGKAWAHGHLKVVV